MSARFFECSFHAALSEDIASNLRQLGHEVESHSLAANFWTLDKHRANKGNGELPRGRVGYKSFNLKSWDNFLSGEIAEIETRAKAWQAECPELNEFNGYIVSVPTELTLLYSGLKGKMIAYVATRFDEEIRSRITSSDAPSDTNGHVLHTYIETIRNLIDFGKLIVLVNNRYDLRYFNHHVHRPATYVSSTCEYIDSFSPKYSPRGWKLLAFGDPLGCRRASQNCGDVLYVRDVLPAYLHAEISMAKGIVWIPYNVSVMSFFEHYWLGIPMFFPSKTFLSQLWTEEMAMRSIGEVPFMNGKLVGKTEGIGVVEWMDTFDFYNQQEFPYLTYFDSWQDLNTKIRETNYDEISANMLKHNASRRERNLGMWRGVVGRLVS